ncbi:MAG: PEP-CTERM sorting domain-containing protein [Armatimonadetes bacterium]|nr:PEP-CTERM sorting domain-containing protein [Armatimonadota bacterium]
MTACLAVLALGTFALAQSVPNPFIKKPAPTLEALLGQIDSDPIVMDRYMRHFGMMPEEVLSYIGTLSLGTVKEDGVYLMYNTPESGEIRARVLFFKKGTKVWVDVAGTYILKVSCGNPMVRGTDDRVVEQDETVALQPTGTLRELAGSPPSGIGHQELVATTQTPGLPDVNAMLLAHAPPPLPVFTSSPQLIGALVVPFTAGFLFNRGNPIPEPATLLALGMAISGFVVARRKRKVA